MILGIGNDLVDLDRFRRVLERRPGLLKKLFTEAEREYALRRSDPFQAAFESSSGRSSARRSLSLPQTV